MVEIRRFFAGSNSAQGFYSLFAGIIGAGAKKVYLLKGGPGTGKSSFMKYMTEALSEEGYDQEHFFCSSDPRSLDAVSFPKLGVALIDATAPHALEPEWPGCRDQLISLSDFWSQAGLESKREEIVEAGLLKRRHFAAAFRYFAAGHAIEENMGAENYPLRRDCSEELREITDRIYEKVQGSKGPGQVRHLFVSALTPEGYVSHCKALISGLSHCYILEGPPGSGKSGYLDRLIQLAQAFGLDQEVFYYPLNPQKPLHVVIPKLDLAVVTATSFEGFMDLAGTRIHCGQGAFGANSAEDRLFRELMDLGFHSLRQAQASHGAVEDYYAQAMDFDALNKCRTQVLADMLRYKNRS